ncbi:hypothetical protein V494_07195 [Pseudogymnoascus sp. VKM F-4513 (FW-928)]|nr:hypothetical protein V494_07195 [Pseudogymnoascus sp. VKM F-4513 (FW-928)]
MFDERSGQVFEERIAKIKSQIDARNWHKKTPISLCQKYRSSNTPAYKSYCKTVEQNRSPPVVKGARTLLYMSINVLVSNLKSLSPATMKRIPQHLLEEIARVAGGRFAELGPLGSIPEGFLDLLPVSAVEEMWTAINQRSHLNLDIWKKISKRLLSDDHGTVKELGLRRYRQNIESPGPDLSFYMEPLTSASFDFLTSLTITAWYPTYDLVNLADIVNLGSLQIYETEKSMVEHRLESSPDRLLRAWARLAVEKGAFSVLRILKFYVLEGGLTDSSLRHFNSFPALGLVYPGPSGMSRNVSVLAEECGWQALSNSPKLASWTLNNVNVVDPQDDNRPSAFYEKPVWHIPRENYGANNPATWDGSEVTTLPSKDRDGFLAALETTKLPTHWLSGTKVGSGERRIILAEDYFDFIQGESWCKTDWDLFCESLWKSKSNAFTEGDVYCIDQFNGFTYLRLDSDLRAAGVQECGAGIASIGDTFKSVISIAPIVSIRLGPRRISDRPKDLTRTWNWHFLRADIPDKVPNTHRPTSNPPDVKSATAPPPSSKRPENGSGRQMRPVKVQKFNDFFGAL